MAGSKLARGSEMASKLKIWGGGSSYKSNWSETRNDIELELVRAAVAAGDEECVWVCENRWSKTAVGYRRLI